MKTQTRVAFITFVAGATLGLASLPLLVSAHEGGDDHEHDHDYPSEQELPENPFSIESDELAAPSQPPDELEVTLDHEPYSTWPARRLKRCVWRTETTDTNTGGVFAQCESTEVPVGNGLHRILSPTNPNHLVVLGFADGIPLSDGDVDGEGLSDSHPGIHGEPPDDGRTATAFTLMTHDRGTGKHNVYDAAYDTHTIVTLCCEVSP